MHSTDVFRFGPFRLVPGRRELLRGGAPIPLGSRAFDLLVALVRRQGRLATKDELMAEVWPGTVVDENNLPAQISALRKILATDPDLAQCLQSAPGRGYRFVAHVAVATEAAFNADAPSAPGHLGEIPSIIVLPFANLSGDVEQAYFALGMTETVTSDLSRIAGLLVIAARTAATFDGALVDVRRVSRELGVRFVLKGSIQRNGRDVRISAQLVDGQSGVQIWSEIFDGDSSNLFALQDQITGRIANSTGREIAVAAARDGNGRQTDPGAWDFIMRGIAADNRPQSLDCLRQQEQFFTRAAQLDPDNSVALAWLARAVLLQARQLHAPAQFKREAIARGGEIAGRALVLDPNNARAHLAMTYLHGLRGELEQSLAASEKAIALDRNLAMAHNMHAVSLLHLGRGSPAVLAADRALRLDPFGPQLDVFLTTKGYAHLLLREIDTALDCFSRARATNPKLARAQAGAAIALATLGDISGARLVTADLLCLAPDYRLSQTADGCFPSSPPAYRKFYDEVLHPGALSAGLPA